MIYFYTQVMITRSINVSIDKLGIQYLGIMDGCMNRPMRNIEPWKNNREYLSGIDLSSMGCYCWENNEKRPVTIEQALRGTIFTSPKSRAIEMFTRGLNNSICYVLPAPMYSENAASLLSLPTHQLKDP